MPKKHIKIELSEDWYNLLIQEFDFNTSVCKKLMDKPEYASKKKNFRNDLGRNSLIKDKMKQHFKENDMNIEIDECASIIWILLENALMYSRQDKISDLQSRTIQEQDKIISAQSKHIELLEKKIEEMALELERCKCGTTEAH